VAFFQILDIACLTLFLITLDCQVRAEHAFSVVLQLQPPPDSVAHVGIHTCCLQLYFNSDTPGRFYHQEFSDVYCWSMPHLIHVFVSIAALLLFALMAGMFTLAEMGR
jgi:hypothetical protein